MKTLAVLASIVFVSGAFAQDLSCKSKTLVGDDFGVVEISIKDSVYKVGKFDSGKIQEVITADIRGKEIADCIKNLDSGAKEKAMKCVKELIPGTKNKNDSVRSLNNMLVHLAMIKRAQTDISDLIDLPSDEELSPEMIAKGKVQVFDFGGKYPNHGIYEYFGSDGKSLARFYFKYLPSLCK